MKLAADPKRNKLIAALSSDDWSHWEKQLQLWEMPEGEVLYMPGVHQEYVYFPVTSVVSLTFTTKTGSHMLFANVGNDGLVGSSLILGGDATPSSAAVQKSGVGFRVSHQFIREEVARAGDAFRLMLRFVMSLMVQITQCAVCNRHHSVQLRLCQLILKCLDRQDGNQIQLTQRTIANMLGTRREGVTEAAQILRTEGLIEYSRGGLKVLNRQGLERLTCECYSTVSSEYKRLLPLRAIG